MSDTPEQTFTLAQFAAALATATTPTASAPATPPEPPTPPAAPAQAAPSAPSGADLEKLAAALRPHLAPAVQHPAPAYHNPLSVPDDPFSWNVDQLNHFARSQNVDREDRYSARTRAFNRSIRERVMAHARHIRVGSAK